MKRYVGVLVAFLLATGVALPQQKKRVAVMNFDYATVQSGVAALFGSNQDVGKGIADLMVDKLVQDGVYSVIERKALDKILAEQNFSNSDRADPSSAAKIAKILGVDAIIIGSITQFGRDDQTRNVSGGGSRLSSFGLGGVKINKDKAVVGITARMIDTSTAEILASATGKGEKERRGAGILGAGGSWAGSGAGALDMTSKNFGATILGEATHEAVDNVARQLESRASALPTKTVALNAIVADVSPDGTIIVNAGSSQGLKVGDRLSVKRKVRDVTDPATGAVLRRIENEVGTITITEVDAKSAVGKFTGSGPAKVGDAVHK